MSSKQMQMEHGEDYPVRPKLFAFDAIQLLSVPMVAHTIGPQGCNLIRLIATMEHEQEYRGAVFARDEDLRPRLAITEKTLVAARRRCIAAGWLHYEPGRKGVCPSRMWVTVPTQIGAKRFSIQWRNSTTTGTESGTRSGTTTGTTTDPSYLIPYPDPISPTSTPWAEGEKAVGELLTESDAALAECRKHGLEPPDVLSLIAWWQTHKTGFRTPLGALHYGLSKAKPSQRSDWSKAFPPTIPQHPATFTSPSSGNHQEKVRELRQLEFKFPEVKQMTVDEVATKFELPDSIRRRLQGYPTMQLVRSDDLRLEIFRHVNSRN